MANAERAARLSAIIDAFPSRRVLVVGDLIADEFIYGEVSRSQTSVSSEGTAERMITLPFDS